MNILYAVKEYADLSQGSRYWEWKCPFTNEIHSFAESPEKGIFYCFGCNAVGRMPYFTGKIKRN